MKRLIVIAAVVISASSSPTPAARAAETCRVPKSWGRLVTVSPDSDRYTLAFEAEDGTIRATTTRTCAGAAKASFEIVRE